MTRPSTKHEEILDSSPDFNLKKENVTWRTIAKAVESSIGTVRSCYRRKRLLEGLPPKVKMSRSKITGRLCLVLKRKVIENPNVTYSELKSLLALECKDPKDAPSQDSIRRFLVKASKKESQVNR